MANSFIGRDMAVDLGTANTLVYVRGKGVLLDEPSVVALNDTTGEILAVGHEAKRMIGRTPDNITAIRPLKDGVIADFEATEQMLRFFIQQVHRRRYFAKPRMVICVPERHHRRRAARGQGGRLPGRRPPGLHRRGADGRRDRRRAARAPGRPATWSSTSAAAPPRSRSSRSAASSPACPSAPPGDDLDQAIVAWMKKEYSLMLGERTAEEVKMTLGSAFPLPDEPEAEIRGRDMVSGLPRTVVVSSAEVRQALEEPLHAIVDAVRATLDQTPPELAGDIMDRGIVLTGGGALLRGLDERLRHETGMPVHVAEDPLTSVALGRRQVRRGVRGAPAGAGLRAAAVLMGLGRLDRRGAAAGAAPSASTASRPSPRALAGRAGAGLPDPDHPRLPRRRRLAGGAGPPRGRRGLRPGRGRHRHRDPPVHGRARLVPHPRRAAATTSPELAGRELPAALARPPPPDYDRNRLAGVRRPHRRRRRPRLRARPGPGGRPRPGPVVLATPSPSTPAPTPACAPT